MQNLRSLTQLARRSFSNQIFSRELKKKHREFALSIDGGLYYDYLREESASNIIDRVEDITRSFPSAMELGSFRGELARAITSRENFRGSGAVGGITTLAQCDIVSEQHIGRNIMSGSQVVNETDAGHLVVMSKKSFDEENGLPFDDHSFDLVLSSLDLHWVNDLPLMLQRIKKVLKPDGAFIASMFGGNTLKELRYCFYLAEQERKGGISPHASPMAKASDVAGLMQGAGFSLPTVDIDTITVSMIALFVLAVA